MPNRIIREGIIDSEKVNSLSPEGEIFYRRLMNKVDDYGRFHAHTALLLAACYPLQLDRVTQGHIASVLLECVKADLIDLYEVEGKKYLCIKLFGQRVRTDSKFPAPCPHDARTMRASREQDDDTLHARARARSESEAYAEPYAEAESEAVMPRAPILEMPKADYGARYRALYDKHVTVGYLAEGEHEYQKIISTAADVEKTAKAIDESHPIWMKHFLDHPSEFCPGIGKWLKDGYWTRRPRAPTVHVRETATQEAKRLLRERRAQEGEARC